MVSGFRMPVLALLVGALFVGVAATNPAAVTAATQQAQGGTKAPGDAAKKADQPVEKAAEKAANPAIGSAVVQVKTAVSADPDDPSGNDINLYTRSKIIDGKTVWIRVRTADADRAGKAMDEAFEEVARIGRKFRPTGIMSEIGRINLFAGREEVIVSSETYTMLTLALKLCRQTQRGFDPTMRSFDYLWAFSRRPFVPPLDDEVAARLAITGCDALILKPNRSVRIARPGVRITVAPLIAGHALQRLARIVESHGITAYRLRIGRDQYAMGSNGTRHWYTSVAHPDEPETELAQVYVGSHGVATRSIHEQAVIWHGKRFHNVLSSSTGKPATGVVQATVVSPNAVTADAVSHALLALGPKKGIAMISGLSTDVEAFVIDNKGTIHATAGMSRIAPKLPSRVKLMR